MADDVEIEIHEMGEEKKLMKPQSNDIEESKVTKSRKKKSKKLKTKRAYTYSQEHGATLDDWITSNISEECSHGKLAFQGLTRNSTALFVRIPLTDAIQNVDKVFHLITDKWHFNKPKNKPSMVVSVNGSLDSLDISNGVLANVKDMIRKISKIPGTWIITEGMHTGVAKLVGSALSAESDVVCIGIPRWGSIKDQDKLETLSDSEESRIYQYHVGASWMKDEGYHYLNPDHTHFLMIDNGKSGDVSKEVRFRTVLERYISTHEQTPSVMVVINGHVNTFRIVSEVVTGGNASILLVKGTGGVADLLVDMITSWQSHLEWQHKMRDGKFKDELNEVEDIDSKWKQLFNCKDSNRFIVTMSENEQVINDLITDTLLRGKKDRTAKLSKLTGEKLQLSLLWNRPEIVRELLPVDNTNMLYSAQKSGMGRDELSFLLEHLLIMALCRGNTIFVEMLLIDYEVDICSVLNMEVLELLYGYQTHEQNFPQLKNEYYKEIEKQYADCIPPEMEVLITEIYGYNANWDIKKRKCTLRVDGINFLRQIFAGKLHLDDVDEVTLKKRPFFELFIWSVLCNLPDMSQFLWPLEGNQMTKALLASFFWEASALNKHAYDDDTVQTLQESDKVFKTYAQDMLHQCYATNKQKTAKLITTKIDFCGGTTCLEVAVDQENIDFVSHSCPQHVLHDVWTGPIQTPERQEQTIRIKKIIAFFLPFLINVFHKFEGDPHHVSCCELAYWKNIWAFYFKTPMVTYTIQSLGDISFLCVYGYSILLKKKTFLTLNISKINFLFWIGYCSIEIFQFTQCSGKTVMRKLARWISDMFNVFDIILLLVFLLATWVEYYGDPKKPDNVAQTIHSVSWVLWCIRVFFRGLRGEGILAVYIHMIFIMIRNLIGKIGAILLMFLPFVFAYGFMSSVLLYPQNELNAFIVLVRPILHVFGVHPHTTTQRKDNTTFMNTPRKGKDYEVKEYQEYVVVVFYIFYLFVATVFLLNILIALFNTSYEEITQQGNKTAKFGWYHFVVEHAKSKPVLIHFVVIPHLYSLLSCLVRKMCGRKANLEWTHKKLNRDGGNERDRIDLAQFESDCAMLVYKRGVSNGASQENDQMDKERPKCTRLDEKSMDLYDLKIKMDEELENMKSMLESISAMEADINRIKSSLESTTLSKLE